MVPWKKNLLDNLALFAGALVLAVTAISVSSPISFKTADDTQILYEILQNKPRQVLGANSEQKVCPEDKPVIGWIDFQGNKKIVENLPEAQDPSACFKDLKEAKENGFTE